MTGEDIQIILNSISKAIDDTLSEFVADETTRGLMRGSILKKMNENLKNAEDAGKIDKILSNHKTND